MMKLHAFADRNEDTDKDLGSHHALDVYTIVGMMTENEYERARTVGMEQAGNALVQRTRKIVYEDFSQHAGIGILRIREHRLFTPDFELDEFRQVLKEICL